MPFSDVFVQKFRVLNLGTYEVRTVYRVTKKKGVWQAVRLGNS